MHGGVLVVFVVQSEDGGEVAVLLALAVAILHLLVAVDVVEDELAHPYC